MSGNGMAQTGKPLPHQILNGVRLAGVIGLVLGALFAVLDSELRVVSAVRNGSFSGYLAGLGELIAVGLLLWCTVGMWSRAIAAVSFLGALKGAIGLVAGTTVSPPFQPVSRFLAAEMVAFLVLAGLLTMRFATRRPNKVEACGLMVLVFSICANMLWEPLHIVVIIGLCPLLFARFFPRLPAPPAEYKRTSSPVN